MPPLPLVEIGPVLVTLTRPAVPAGPAPPELP
jgi:hypothetical protein